MGQLLHLGEMVRAHARSRSNKVAALDSSRSLTFRDWNSRANRLANGLRGLGLESGDRVAVLAYNCVEWLEIYVGLARAGLVGVPYDPILMLTLVVELLLLSFTLTAVGVMVAARMKNIQT